MYTSNTLKKAGVSSLPSVDELTGFWFVAYAGSGSNTRDSWNVNAKDDPNWEINYGNTHPFVVNQHVHTSSAPSDTGVQSGQINDVNLVGLEFYLQVYNGTWYQTRADFDLEFLDSDGNIVAVLRALRDASFKHKLWYGPDWNSLTRGPYVGSVTLTTGYLRFDEGGFDYVHRSGIWPTKTSYNDSFRCNADMTQVTTLNFKSFRVYQDYNGAAAYVTLKLLGTTDNPI